jgi:hypothetical protein
MLIGKRICRRHSRPDNRWQLLDELNAVKEVIHNIKPSAIEIVTIEI